MDKIRAYKPVVLVISFLCIYSKVVITDVGKNLYTIVIAELFT